MAYNAEMGQGMSNDGEHLQLLSIFHYILCGITALVACFPLIHLVIGLALLCMPPQAGQQSPPPFLGWLFVGVASVLILAGWTLALFMFLAGRAIARRERHFFCVVVAGCECLMMPLGTVLGVFTIIVLMRPSVKMLFQTVRPPDIAAANR